jgi:predicted DNA binding CopG/RHH family protein
VRKDEPSTFARFNPAEASESALEDEIELLKNLLLEHDRSLFDKLSGGEKPSFAEKRRRSRIIRQLNRTRRQLYRLKTVDVRQPSKKITFRIAEEDYSRLQALAQQEGLSLSAYIRKQLFPDQRKAN